MRWHVPFLCAVLGGLPAGALAQDAGSLLREQERRQELQRLERIPLPDGDRARPLPRAVPESGPTVTVTGLRFRGKVELLSEAERGDLAASAKGRRLGIAGLTALADRITLALQRKGRLLARAVLPPQDISGGVVTIQIIEGDLERIEFERRHGVRLREGLLDGIIGKRVDPRAVTKADLESSLLRMNDLPGVTTRAKLVPGTAPNTTRLVIVVDEAPPIGAVLEGDNFGTPSTGRAQATGQATLTDLTGFGEQARIQGVLSEGQVFGQAGLAVPVWTTGLVATASYARLDYRNITALGRAAELAGHAQYASGGLEHSLVRSRELNLRLAGAANWKGLVDESIAGRLSDKRIVSGTLSALGDLRDDVLGGGFTTWSLAWTSGDLDLSRVPAALAADAAGLNTQGTFHRVNASVARLQKLPGDFSLFARLYGQWASRNLDSSEDFALGGPFGVRAYPVGEARGDMGVLSTAELRYDAPLDPGYGQVQLLGFADAGHVRINKDPGAIPALNACRCNTYSLYAAGAGLRWTLEAVSVSLMWAHALGTNPGASLLDGSNSDGRTSRQQIWLQGAVRF
jgi:hemolysin activation/secretion protein